MWYAYVLEEEGEGVVVTGIMFCFQLVGKTGSPLRNF